MSERGATRRFQAGELIFREGDDPDCAYVIDEGEVEVWIELKGEHLTLARLGPGEILGEMAVIDRAPRSASALALSAVSATEIRADQLRARLEKADPILKSLLVGLLSRYRRSLRAAGASSHGQSDHGPGHAAGRGEQQRRVVDKIRLESELLDAIGKGELRIVFQPVVDIDSGLVAGFEALVRWVHPERGSVSPAEFIALAEETSLIVPVGQHVLRRACEALQAMDRRLPSTVRPWIAVNISARQSVLPDFADAMAQSARSVGLSPARLKVEITESLALDYERVQAFIARCREHGMGVSLDDFGTGYSSLGHLHRLDFDSVKLDQSFVRGVPEDHKASALICGITDLIRRLGAEVVAEGVENERQAKCLREMGVRFMQGWWVGKPREPLEWIDRLRAGHA
jgi:EAL domain-containing protein (putative c-di-GMP-specific phosphodiesterase class I)